MEKFLARQEFGNLWTLRDPQPSDSSIYLYLTLEVFQTYDNSYYIHFPRLGLGSLVSHINFKCGVTHPQPYNLRVLTFFLLK